MRIPLLGAIFGIVTGFLLAPLGKPGQPVTSDPGAGPGSILAGVQRGSSTARAFAAMSDERLPAIEQLRLAATWRPPETVAGLLKALRELQSVDSRQRSTLQARILLQLVRVDAGAGFEAIAESDLEGRPDILKEYVRLWAATDPRLADAAIRGFEGDAALRTDLAKKAAEVMAGTESRLAVELVLDFNVSFHGGSSLEKAFAKIAEESPLEAAKLAFAVEDRQAYGWAVQNVMHEWAKRDGKAAIEYLRAQEITDTNRSAHWWRALISGWAEADPEAALVGIEEEVSKSRASSLRAEVLKTWAKSEPQAALDHVSGIDDQSERQSLFGLLSGELAGDHPALALEALLESDRPREGSGLFRTFAEKDWEGTMATLGQWEDPEFRAQAAVSMINYAHYNGRHLGDEERNQLIDWIAEVSSSVPPSSVQSIQVTEALDHETIVALSSRQPELYEMLIPRAIREVTSADPRRALELLDTISAETRSTRQSRQEAINAWALQEPAEAAAWAESDPAAATNDGTFFNIASAWSAFAPASAEEWISSLASPESRDQAARGFAETVMFRDSETALGVAEQIRDEAARHEVLTTIWGHRLNRDVTAAKRDLENAELPAAVRAALEPRIAEAEAWHRFATSGE